MKRKILLAVVLLVSLLTQIALADVVVSDFNGYLVEIDNHLQPWIFYEITNNGSEAVKISSDSEVIVIDPAGNTIGSDTIFFSPNLLVPGEKAYGHMAFHWNDDTITSMDQVDDFHLNIKTEDILFDETITYYEPASTKFKAKDSLFGGMSITQEVVYKNETGELQSVPEAIFILRDESGKIVHTSREYPPAAIESGKSYTIKGYVADAVRKFFKKYDFKPASMEVILYEIEIG